MTGSREELQKKIEGCRENSAGARQYPPTLRSEICRYLDREVRAGGHFTQLCSELGVHAVVARRWGRMLRQGSFAAVTVTEQGEPRLKGLRATAKPASALVVDTPAAFTLTSPGGWRIDGLSLEAVTTLLPRLP